MSFMEPMGINLSDVLIIKVVMKASGRPGYIHLGTVHIA
jgi:hypothetical protein